MEYKNLTKSQKIPVLGLGTWRMGGELWSDSSEDRKYINAVRYAIKGSVTHLDTAEVYGAGHTEEIVGKSIKKFDRKKLFITTKVSPHHLSPKQIHNSCQNSLKRLQTDYIDLYLIHWPNPLASMKNAVNAFDELVSKGKIKYIGVSNFSLRQLKNAQKYTKNKIITNQVHYSLLHREPEKELLPYCQKEGIILTAYSPLEIGELGKEKFYALESIAKKYKKTAVQIALRWLIEKPQVIVIPKASSHEHIDELLGSLGWKLGREDLQFLDLNF